MSTGGVEISSTLSLTSAPDGMGGQHHVPTALPPGKNWYLLYRRLGAPHGLSGRVRKTSDPQGFYSQNVEPLASRCTDCPIPAHVTLFMYRKLFWKKKGPQTTVWQTAGRGLLNTDLWQSATGTFNGSCTQSYFYGIQVNYRFFCARLLRYTRYVHHCTSLAPTPLAF